MAVPQPMRVDRARLVLLVDDEPMLLQLMERALLGAGYGVLSTTDGLHALEVVRRGIAAPDILVTDIRMDCLDGVTLAGQVRDRCPNVRVLLVSGWAPDQLEPPWPFLRKPFHLDQFIDAVGRLQDDAAQGV